jgi:hypothetical protein
MNLPAACCGVLPESGSYPPHPALSPGGARESSNPAACCRESFGLKVEIRIKTKNRIEDIIKQKYGKADRGKKVPTSCWSASAKRRADFIVWQYKQA